MSDCTEETIQEYIETHLDYPKNALSEGQGGLEKVTFIVEKMG